MTARIRRTATESGGRDTVGENDAGRPARDRLTVPVVDLRNHSVWPRR